MKQTLLSTIFTFCLISAFAQTNQLNINGKKQGTWKVYLNSNWKEIKDTNQAAYIMYAHYENGYNTTPTGNRSGVALTLINKHTKELLDGEYKWVNKKGEIKYVDVFDKGKYVTSAYYKKGKKVEEADHRILWKGKPNTYRMSVIKDDKTEYYFMRNGPKGWRGYRGAADGE